MTLTDEDRQALYSVWMTRKTRLHLTQMETAKHLGLTLAEFSSFLRGPGELTMAFVGPFCVRLNVDPYTFLPTLMQLKGNDQQTIHLVSKVTVDGVIESVQVEGNQVVIQYSHCCEAGQEKVSMC